MFLTRQVCEHLHAVTEFTDDVYMNFIKGTDPSLSPKDNKWLTVHAEGLGAHLPGVGDCNLGLQSHEPRHAHC